MNPNHQAKSIWSILIACSMSGLISGNMVTQDFRSDFLNFEWESQFGQGIVFGLLFSITSIGTYLRNKDHRIFGAIVFTVLFTIASTIIYFIAFQIAMWTMMILSNSSINGFVAGGMAGLFGAGVLAISAKFISETPITSRDEIMTTAVGTVAGILFFLVLPGDSLTEVNWSLPFVIWQAGVGWSLSRSLLSLQSTLPRIYFRVIMVKFLKIAQQCVHWTAGMHRVLGFFRAKSNSRF